MFLVRKTLIFIVLMCSRSLFSGLPCVLFLAIFGWVCERHVHMLSDTGMEALKVWSHKMKIATRWWLNLKNNPFLFIVRMQLCIHIGCQFLILMVSFLGFWLFIGKENFFELLTFPCEFWSCLRDGLRLLLSSKNLSYVTANFVNKFIEFWQKVEMEKI